MNVTPSLSLLFCRKSSSPIKSAYSPSPTSQLQSLPSPSHQAHTSPSRQLQSMPQHRRLKVIYLSIYLSIYLPDSLCLSIPFFSQEYIYRLYTNVSVCLSICLSVSMYVHIYVSICLSIHADMLVQDMTQSLVAEMSSDESGAPMQRSASFHLENMRAR